ncbi:arabinofuranan 3-O-arabinosyltransferase [Pedococcus dokdonensis]|uniref:Arabinofuranan 3-O-arabinosyltransferase n=1 Tax=Pedococcus dokdonensis TaxID=443156 RepID=A0A1H0PB89_9MICO|nr:alpha-(1->3)-arabinofuranosyltransferase family protein [Pedococcus dokdonensis]SDP01909.1 arabinofuranan 3-O-arabinosyltransferase [Pedococcus dokdonensis]
MTSPAPAAGRRPGGTATPPVRPVPLLVDRVRTFTCLLVLWAVAFAQQPGKVVADTKIDLALDPWGLMSRALHLWDPTTAFGVLQNQGYGYLFPMGPFAALGQLLAPPWVVQRLWWAVLLTAGFLAARALLSAWQVADPVTRQVTAVAFALSPRVVSTLGPISSEAAPALLAPAILLPVVLADQGRLGARRAAALSALAVLCCGGVNATATAFAVVPTGLWLVTRSRWWRASLTWWWAASVAAASAWWAVPLVVLGRYSPPFLDWIESSDTVTRTISLLDDLRGTSHWLGHLVTQAGPWWNAGFDLVAAPSLVIGTTVAAAVGLAGLTLRGLPHRGYLVMLAVLGVLVLAVPHHGPQDSPLRPVAQHLLDGPLAPLRNVHKADPLLRVPLMVAFAHGVGLLARRGLRLPVVPRRATRPVAVVAALVACAAALSPVLPGIAGQLASRGSFTAVPKEWEQAGRWLDRQPGGGTALVVPASNFDEYTWGRPLDLVLRTQTSASSAVRDAVPLTPANTVRLLDAVETRLQTGRALGGVVDVLRSAGVRHVVLRNDLDTRSTGGVPVSVARSSIARTTGLTRVAAFGDTFVDGSGNRIRPVEVYAIPGTATAPAELTPLTDVVSASGASESLPDLREAGVEGPVVFDGDVAADPVARRIAADAASAGRRVVTDSMRARDRAFGAVRGRDVSQTLAAGDQDGLHDYLPWEDPRLRTTIAWTGLRDLRASGSLATDAGPGGLDPADRPFSALDGLATTAWVVSADGRPSLTMTFDRPRSVAGLEVSSLADRSRFGDFLGIPTRLRVTTDAGGTDLDLAPTGRPQPVTGLPSADTTRLTLQVLETDRGADALVTGLSEVRVPGLVVRETAIVPSATAAAADDFVLSEQYRGSDGCTEVRDQFVCRGEPRAPEDAAGLDRTIPVSAGIAYAVSGTLGAVPGPGLDALLDLGAPGTVTASSRLSRAPQARPGAVLDGDPATAWAPDPADATPTLGVELTRPARIAHLQLQTRGEWLTGRDVTAQVTVDGRVQLAEVAQDGSFDIRPTTGRSLRVRLLLAATRQDAERDARPAAGMEVTALAVEGVEPAAAPDRVTAGCGSGPRLLVEGVAVPTRVTGPRSAAYGVGALSYEACDPVRMSPPEGRVAVEPWGGFVPERLVLARTDRPAASAVPARSVEVTATATGDLTAQVGSGAAALLTIPQNANPGWRASLDGRDLDPVTVDGWRQGFVVPAGDGGRVTLAFGPDRPYRWGLLAGLLLVLVVVGSALVPSRRTANATSAARVGLADGAGREARPGPAGRVPVGAVTAITGLLVGWLLAGWWGLLVAVPCVAVGSGRRWPLRPGHRLVVPVLVTALVTTAGLVQAWWVPGRLGGPATEAALRLLCVAALTVVVSASGRSGRAPGPSTDARPGAR